MPHELKGLHLQSHEYFTQLLLADLVLLVVVVAFVYYLHRKHAKLTKPPRAKGGALRVRRKRRR